MLHEQVFAFDNANSGHMLRLSGVMYFVTTGHEWCDVGQNPISVEWGSFFRFDTSSLPDDADLHAVFFKVRRRADSAGDPEDYEIRVSIGDIIGGSLDGNATEWAAGTEMLTLDAKPIDKTLWDLSADGGDPTLYVNLSGDTDIKILDHSYLGTGDDSWTTNFNKSTTERCWMSVRYYLPSMSATGVGVFSCAGQVTHNATVEATGSGTVAGTGSAIRSASASATGVGSVSVAGVGIYNASVTAAGIGSVSADGDLIARGSATIVGVGGFTGSAAMTASAAATVIGVGVMTVAGGFLTQPLALHMANRTVADVHTNSASVAHTDTATRSVDPDHVATRNPRRITDA